MSTLTCKNEACLNSRPLTYIPSGDKEHEILTPAHFLIQRPPYVVPEPPRDVSISQVTHTKRYQWIYAMVQSFWNLWTKDYLKAKQERTKWFQFKPNFEVRDVVLLLNQPSPPSEWPLGIITAVYPDGDGTVQVVELKTATSTLTRPTKKLALLVRDELISCPTINFNLKGVKSDFFLTTTNHLFIIIFFD